MVLKVISFNVRGLRSPHKRGRLWLELRHLAADVVFLQETHFVEGSIPSLPQYAFNQWYHAVSPIARARGTTIAFRKSCPWKMESVETDPEGRFLFAKGTLHGACYTLASIYAPNEGTINFIAKTLRKLEKFGRGF